MYHLQGIETMMPFDACRGITPGGSRVFYVNCRSGVGSDDNEGTDPQYPLATLEAAYLKCTANKGDYVFAQDFWTASAPPLTIAKADIHLIALGSGNFDAGNDITNATASTASVCIEDAGYDFELAGFNLSSTGTSGVALEMGEAYRSHVHHCTFGCNLAATTGMAAMTGGGSFTHSSLHDCLFGTLVSGTCITVPLNTSMVFNNIFGNAGASITPVSIATNVHIFNNMFVVPDNASGEAISLLAAATGCMIMDNIASNGMLQSGYTYNPYKDLAANTANHWAKNYRGNAIIEPVGI